MKNYGYLHYKKAKQKFYKMFCELKEEIDRNWI